MLVGFSAALLFGSLWAATPASAATETWDTPVFGGYDWVVPAGVTTARFDVFGGQGAGVGASRGGDGGETAGTIAVTPGETLKINVGGAAPAPGLGSGLNGGGGAGSPICSDGGFACTGGGGGGASDVRQGGTATANRVLVAGGGGGAGGASSGFCNDFGCLVSVAGGDGADGGAPAAVRGADGVDGVNEAPHSGGCGGGGATQLGGGIRGGGTGMELCFGPTGNAANGGEGNGGRGGDAAQAAGSGGGGGGGYFGGGGGSGGAARSGGGGGGGGSGFAAAAATNVSIAGGVNGGDGLVTVTYGADVAPTNTAPPKISGTPAAGHTLTCAKGTWSGSTPRTYTRQWRRDNVAIPGQTNAAYLVAAGDVAHVIRCRVTAHNAFGQATATSAGLTIQTPPQSISPPAISGNPAPGQTLICGKGSWSGSTPLTYTRQWRRDGLAIGGATNSTYLVQAADAGHSLRCKVTAHNAAGSDSRTSAAVNVA